MADDYPPNRIRHSGVFYYCFPISHHIRRSIPFIKETLRKLIFPVSIGKTVEKITFHIAVYSIETTPAFYNDTSWHAFRPSVI